MIIKIILILILFSFLILLIPRVITGIFACSRIAVVADVQPRQVAIVFGAGLWPDGSATPVLHDRVKVAAELYFGGKVERLLMSGDNRFISYNEPGVMRQVALELGVPAEHIVLDYAGRRTYDTCYRARAIFGVTEAILVTQNFHLPRALYTCNQLGVDSVGIAADLRNYREISVLYWNLRELIATSTALWDVHIRHPIPVLGDEEPIFQ